MRRRKCDCLIEVFLESKIGALFKKLDLCWESEYGTHQWFIRKGKVIEKSLGD